MPKAAEDRRRLLEQIAPLSPRGLYEVVSEVVGVAYPPCLLHPETPPVVVELAGAGDGALPEPVRVPTTPTALVGQLASAIDQILGHLAWVESAADELDFSGAGSWSYEEAETAWTEVRDSYRVWASEAGTRRDLWYETVDGGRGLRRRRELDRLAARASRVATKALPSFIARDMRSRSPSPLRATGARRSR